MQDIWVGGSKRAGSGRTSSRSSGSRDGPEHLGRGQAAGRVQPREARCAGDGPPGEGVEAQRGQVCPPTAQQDGKLNRASSISSPLRFLPDFSEPGPAESLGVGTYSFPRS